MRRYRQPFGLVMIICVETAGLPRKLRFLAGTFHFLMSSSCGQTSTFRFYCEMMVLDLVVNPNAGRRRGLDAVREVRSLVAGTEVTLREHLSEYPGHTIQLAAHALTLQPRSHALVAVGGDGTLFELLNGVSGALLNGGPRVPVGVVPVGTGNSFVRDLSIANVEDAVTAITGGSTRRVDVGVLSCAAGQHTFINLLGAGFVSSVAHRAARFKQLGALSYVIAVLQETVALRSNRIVLTIDGRRIERDAIFVEVCNSRFTGGAMMMAPAARIDDGAFDVVVMSACSRRKLLSLFPRIFSGRHVEDPLIEVFHGASVTLETERSWLLTPDGETFGSTPIRVEMRPLAVEMFVPAGMA